ncbi:MAG TPA: LysM peptidoglycan-binding domain-containing protein [Desulfitobacterium dehalogenans]|uniref:LysM peptidoglycan-binding domain-containing protein n=1 Tax=Desulfitobacterium dehalogenans TaxID=36854 RepID=A0A7C6Z239_9FIRM|nr:LysM peptidoglycan-binding domain-containing protein [Desulfitobacterium dehalogenans]
MDYTVQPGDSFYIIAQKHGLSLEELQQANPQIQNPTLIFPGQVIKLPDKPCPQPYEKYRVDEPYPEIKVLGENPYYAQLLYDDYAGQVSELTAIMQYVHHHMQMDTHPAWREVAALQEGISIIEMKHLEMLGETILLLGGNARYWDGCQQPWTPLFVSYHDFDFCAQLRADIQAEEEAIHNYRNHIQQIQDPYIQALLARIIKDEEHHLRLFRDSLAKHCGS